MADETKVQQNNEKILGILQEAVNAETTSRNLYWSRSVYWRNAGIAELAQYYLDQSQEDHAQRSADRMAQLGRQSEVDPSRVDSFGDDVKSLLQVDLAVEVELADGYRYWVQVAETERDYVTRQIWCEVLASTEAHVDLLRGWIDQINTMGEGCWLATWRTEKDRG